MGTPRTTRLCQQLARAQLEPAVQQAMYDGAGRRPPRKRDPQRRAPRRLITDYSEAELEVRAGRRGRFGTPKMRAAWAELSRRRQSETPDEVQARLASMKIMAGIDYIADWLHYQQAGSALAWASTLPGARTRKTALNTIFETLLYGYSYQPAQIEAVLALLDGAYPPLSLADLSVERQIDVIYACVKRLEVVTEPYVRALVALEERDELGVLAERVAAGEVQVTPEASAFLAKGSQPARCRALAAAAGYLTGTALQQLCGQLRGEWADVRCWAEVLAPVVADPLELTDLWVSAVPYFSRRDLERVVPLWLESSEVLAATLLPHANPEAVLLHLVANPRLFSWAGQVLQTSQEPFTGARYIRASARAQFANNAQVRQLATRILFDAPGVWSTLLMGQVPTWARQAVAGRVTETCGTHVNTWQRFFVLAESWEGTLTNLLGSVDLLSVE